jgi:hypothetical protein
MVGSWDQKLRRLQQNLRDGEGVTAEELAGTLGITTRTLADFMKPVADGGREPTGPVQRLIDLLLGEMDSQDLARKPKLNLVIIHGDFRVSGEQDPVDAIVTMHSAGGRNNEFHYITVAPERGASAKWAIEGLSRRRIQPHFFATDPGLNTQEAMDCYFTATAMWLATQAMRRDLAHITLAADVRKFWPLARELKELAEVDVTMVREAGYSVDKDQDALLQGIGIGVADPAGRNFGRVMALKGDATSKVSYGFIVPSRAGKSGKPVPEAPLFFSWNHMRRDKSGIVELEIDKLVVGDEVSFGIGMNNRGPCAIDVALVGRAADAPPLEAVSAKHNVARRSKPEEAELVDILKDAVSVCADKDGWARLSDVGNRINVLHPNFKERLQAVSFQKILGFAAAYPAVFELSPDGQGTPYAAACLRLKPTLR